ncbi:2-oxo-4-hydroxy-4-carboxy-5-ureidoimidazoline decarboxylase [Roseomonas sp. BN140053]|uniref:2-oxo-4-hydroxy-4-carboxy-5-ureidoimidazoline decarboxylase n=1 Tax=Roseomonas sp. BN140053 TaxID=3391898 RepID=UPI0039E9542F
MVPRLTLDALNAATTAEFVAALEDLFEHTPWVPEAAAAQRPFATVAALHAALMRPVLALPPEGRKALLNRFPDLAGKAARGGTMGAASVSEHAGLGLDRLSEAEFATFERLNAAYRDRFGFPFMICVRRQTRDAVLAAFERRLRHDEATELAAALAELGFITRLRLVERVDGPGAPATAGRLSTHVLDTLRGRGAAGLRVELFEVGGSARARLAEAVTNAEGRTDAPLLGGAPLRVGRYELVFHLGAYYAAAGVALPRQPFLDEVPIRFGIDEPEGHYHVPLVASPWTYTTYRGS